MSTTPGPRSSRAAILDTIRAAGTISRVEIVRSTGLTGATVSTVVRRLIDDGLVLETGPAESSGGKPRVLLALDPTARSAVGVHLDHGGITYVLADLGGAVVARRRTPGAGSDDPHEVVRRIAGDLTTLLGQAGAPRARVLGLGVVSPGPLTRSAGMVLTPPVMARWADFPLADALEDALALPVLVDNDATAAAIGEYWVGGAGRDSAFAALYMGTGVGAGILVDGVAYRGSSSNTGEVGHLCVDVDGPECWCGSRGCIEAVAGPVAVVARARADGLIDDGDRHVAEDFGSLARAALRGEPAAERLLLDSARYLGVAAQALANLMDLDQVVLTGSAFAVAGSLYLPAVQRQLDRSFLARRSHPVTASISLNAADAAAVGGAALVLQSELTPTRSPRGVARVG